MHNGYRNQKKRKLAELLNLEIAEDVDGSQTMNAEAEIENPASQEDPLTWTLRYTHAPFFLFTPSVPNINIQETLYSQTTNVDVGSESDHQVQIRYLVH